MSKQSRHPAAQAGRGGKQRCQQFHNDVFLAAPLPVATAGPAAGMLLPNLQEPEGQEKLLPCCRNAGSGAHATMPVEYRSYLGEAGCCQESLMDVS